MAEKQVPKYKTGDRFSSLPGKTGSHYKGWKTVVVVGDSYISGNSYNSDAVFYTYYPVHVNGDTYAVIPECNLRANFIPYVEFKAGYFYNRQDKSEWPSLFWFTSDPGSAWTRYQGDFK